MNARLLETLAALYAQNRYTADEGAAVLPMEIYPKLPGRDRADVRRQLGLAVEQGYAERFRLSSHDRRGWFALTRAGIEAVEAARVELDAAP